MQQTLARLAAQAKPGRNSLETIRRLDRELAALRLGVKVYLSHRPFYRRGWVLGYGQTGENGWGLVVRGVDPESATLPLAEAPREVQMEALVLVPKLLTELGRQVEVAVRGIEWARAIPETLPRLAGEARRRPRRP